jgi:hypothetical protein
VRCWQVIFRENQLYDSASIHESRLLFFAKSEALPDGGALIVYERLIDDDRRTNSAGLLASLHMLIMTAGGVDFTAADCVGWGLSELTLSRLRSGFR